MRTDVNYSHSKNMGEAIGSFCDVPIRAYDNFELEVDLALASQWSVLIGGASVPAEILPGELLCSDNIIRRVTTAEATGYDTFKEKNPVKMLVGANDGREYNTEDSQWYMKEQKLRQSTPEELSAWLNDMPKRTFSLAVQRTGMNKEIRAVEAEDKMLYAFRYLEGTPETYIGGDEVRPFDPPQFKRGDYSPSHVVQYFDNGNDIHRKPVDFKEYRDELESKYIPTSHLERLTVGGTALFDELKAEIAALEPEIKLAQPQTCDWYPDGDTPCLNPITHPRTKTLAGTCDSCYAEREARC